MDSTNSSIDWSIIVANIADSCMKPWKHAVICENFEPTQIFQLDQQMELIMKIKCRNLEGERIPENDLDLEIFRSGNQLNLMLCWSNKSDSPILWQGSHSVWMNGENGLRCKSPKDGISLESLARRLRHIFDQPIDS
jgi:hypothetical protein